MKRFLVVLFYFLCINHLSYTQCAADNDAIQAGEGLVYNLKFNWKFVWVDAGTARMSVQSTVYNDRPCFKTSLISVSNKKVDFFFKMRDTLTSISTTKLEPLYFRKGAEEGKRYTIDQAWFSYKDGYCTVNQKRTHKSGEVKTSSNTSKQCVFDMLTILLQARSYDASKYAVGQKINFLMATGRKVEEQTLIYRGKEIFTSENGVKYRCLVFSLVEYKNRKEKEVITFYVTDDKNHLPVRLDLFLNFGSAKAFLKSVRGNKYPLTSIITD